MADASSDMVGDGPACAHWLQMGYSGARPFPHANLAEVAADPECAHRSRPRREGLCTKVAVRPQQLTDHRVRSSETWEAAATAAKPDESLQCRRPARPPRPLRSLPAAASVRPAAAASSRATGTAALAPCRSGGGTECRWLKPRATQPAGALRGPGFRNA